MPIKYGKTEKRIDRQTKKVNIVATALIIEACKT